MTGWGRSVAGLLFTALTAALTLWLLRLFGLIGPLVLVALFGLAGLGFYLMRRRAQRLMREKFAQMTGRARVTALYSLSGAERAELLAALKDQDK